MRITVIGAGYVGLVASTGFAENGHQVRCVDRDGERIATLQEGCLPIYEPGLMELITRNVAEDRLVFTTSLSEAVADCLLIFLCVGTPSGDDGQADLSQVFGAAEEIARCLTGYAIVVNKSTCPVGTVQALRERIGDHTSHPFDVVANPEFMKEGNAVDDFMRPDRVVVGSDEVRVLEIMKELYSPFLRTGKPFIAMSPESAELTKYAVNSMLAVRISMVNELANLAGAYGCDINEIRQAVMADSRIGPAYLFPGIGFGGSCLPKDIVALGQLASLHGLDCPTLEGAIQTNNAQAQKLIDRIISFYDGGLKGKRLAFWGASFKPRTDDIRNAPALTIVDALLEEGASISLYDPVAGPKLSERYGDRIDVSPKMYDALDGAEGLVVATEWREFHYPDFERMGEQMARKVVFDGRNLYEAGLMKSNGFRYISVGRQDV